MSNIGKSKLGEYITGKGQKGEILNVMPVSTVMVLDKAGLTEVTGIGRTTLPLN